MNSITVNVSTKETIRFKLLKRTLWIGAKLKLVNPKRAINQLERLLDKGWALKYRLDNGKWRLLRSD